LLSSDDWFRLDVDELAQLYETEITVLLDRLVAARPVTCPDARQTPTTSVGRRTALYVGQILEAPHGVAASKAAWIAQRRAFSAVRNVKISGTTESTLIAKIHVNCSDQWTLY